VNSLGQHVQFAGTVLDITERKQQEQAIQELSGRLIGAQEQERARIARELHDNISQQIAIVCIELQQLKDSLPGSLHEGRERAQALWHKAAAISTELQQLSHQLHSTKLKHLGVTAAVRGLCREFLEQQGIEADFQSRNIPRDLDTDIALALFRVAQESLHNVAKHSGAKQVRLELVATAAEIVLRVSDDGSGFDTGAAAHRNGLGMVSMSERLRLLGGTLSVTSKLLKGTRIEAAVPLLRKDDA
jgi:signal transduction histidine kinase